MCWWGTPPGGIIVREFAARHPEELAGLVLVDSSHEDQHHRLAPFKDHDRLKLCRRGARRLLTPLGLIRVARDLGIRKRPSDPVGIMEQTWRWHRAAAQELIAHALTRPGTKPPELGDLPVMVLTAGAVGRGDYEPVWQQMQRELAVLSTCSTNLFAERSGHHINRDDPDFIVQASLDMINDYRRRRGEAN
jgi:pimeloyl-ACP methyl ester carboxylesterase